jgi:uncharacterized protein YlxW (UPF0749 family)
MTPDELQPRPQQEQPQPQQERPEPRSPQRDRSDSMLVRALRPRLRRVDLLVALLLGLLGFGAVVQVRATQEEGPLAGARQEDLVQILDDLANRNQRLRSEIGTLTAAQERLSTGTDTTEAALEEARRRAQVLGVLAGTVPAEGPGVSLVLTDTARTLSADVLLDALQELRDAGAEAVMLEGPVRPGGGPTDQTESVRVVASTALLDDDQGVRVDGVLLRPPYRFAVVSDPPTIASALGIPGGVIDTVEDLGGQVEVVQLDLVVVSALRPLEQPQYAQPAPDGD